MANKHRVCNYMMFPGRMHVDPEPPEYCDEDVENDEDEYCPQHQALFDEDSIAEVTAYDLHKEEMRLRRKLAMKELN